MTSDTQSTNYRAMEDTIHTDFKNEMSYGDYLSLDQLLSAQNPLTDSRDEMLFIVIHQSSELWLKLMGREIEDAIQCLHNSDFGLAFKIISRVKQVFIQLTQSWNILSTLTPVDYLKFREKLGHSSGFQSYSYRKLEFLLGNKNRSLVQVHEAKPNVYQDLMQTLESPSLYDHVIKILNAKGYNIDAAVLDRDYSEPYNHNDSVLNAWLEIYRNPDAHFELYELAEKLMDIEDSFQQWRFKHMYTVQRIIGNKMGTGGSSGVEFLKKALDIKFFPELYQLRTLL
ncbi:tryptophan 2,3-dioxygenase [Aliikangiella maris]|uniref:Tryptophan 2,3-dioxygenase family protein n=2 Tax=Aliikangiella maris TaxID=3162458 RepID=A0ABV2BYQ1_9GAMM